MNITVYLGANEGNDPCLRQSVKELGTWIGSSGNALVYGGSKSGLMGAIADSVLQAGGEVTGIEPQFFIENELQHDGLTQLIVTKDMSERIAASRGREPSGVYAQRKQLVNSEVPELKVSFWKILPIHCSASAGDNRNQGNQNSPFSICS